MVFGASSLKNSIATSPNFVCFFPVAVQKEAVRGYLNCHTSMYATALIELYSARYFKPSPVVLYE